MEKKVIDMHLRNIAFVARPYVKTFLRLVIFVVSTSMAFILSGINPPFASFFSVLALIEVIKFTYLGALKLKDGLEGEWVDASDKPIRIVFLILFFFASVESLATNLSNSLPSLFFAAITLVIGLAWVLSSRSQEDAYDKFLSEDPEFE